MDIEKLIKEIIPPSDYRHRNGFNNSPIIDSLTSEEKGQVEAELIYMLQYETGNNPDTLIVETLAYLKSPKSLSALKNLLENAYDDMTILKIASSIFEISGENDMVNIAISSVKKMDNHKDPYYVYKLTTAFYYLVRFKNPEIDEIIKSYVNHKEYLVSYNAKRALDCPT